eukprot:2046680-Amphidinium_carterae.1
MEIQLYEGAYIFYTIYPALFHCHRAQDLLLTPFVEVASWIGWVFTATSWGGHGVELFKPHLHSLTVPTLFHDVRQAFKTQLMQKLANRGGNYKHLSCWHTKYWKGIFARLPPEVQH